MNLNFPFLRVESSLCNNQHAYRKNRSCHSAISIFSQFIYNNIDKPKTKVVSIFFDLRSAFDSVSHDLLVNKLMVDLNLEPKYVKLINEGLTNRVFSIHGNDKLYSLPCGVPQGSALGPLLFSIFINKIGDAISCPFLTYADDLVIYQSGTNSSDILESLQKDVIAINEWCKLNGLKINFDKTKYMVFHKDKDVSIKMECHNKLEIENNVIERVYEFKYLGLIFEPCMKFKNILLM